MEYGNNMTRKQFLELPVKAWDETKDYKVRVGVPSASAEG